MTIKHYMRCKFMEPKTIKCGSMCIKPLWYHTEALCGDIYHLEVYYILMVDSTLERKYFGFPCALLTNQYEVARVSGIVNYLDNIRRIYGNSSWGSIIKSMVEGNFSYVRDRGDFVAFSKEATQTQFGFLYAKYIARTMMNLRRMYVLDNICIPEYIPSLIRNMNRFLARRCVGE